MLLKNDLKTRSCGRLEVGRERKLEHFTVSSRFAKNSLNKIPVQIYFLLRYVLISDRCQTLTYFQPYATSNLTPFFQQHASKSPEMLKRPRSPFFPVTNDRPLEHSGLSTVVLLRGFPNRFLPTRFQDTRTA